MTPIASSRRRKLLIAAAIISVVVALWAFVMPAVLQARFRSDDWHAREQTARILGFAPVPGGEDMLIRALESEREVSNVCEACVHSLVERGSTSAEPVLIRMAGDLHEDPLSRYCAIRGLGHLGSDRCVDILIALLREDDLDGWGFDSPAPRMAVRESLRAVTGQDFGVDHEKWREWRANSRSTR